MAERKYWFITVADQSHTTLVWSYHHLVLDQHPIDFAMGEGRTGQAFDGAKVVSALPISKAQYDKWCRRQ